MLILAVVVGLLLIGGVFVLIRAFMNAPQESDAREEPLLPSERGRKE